MMESKVDFERFYTFNKNENSALSYSCILPTKNSIS